MEKLDPRCRRLLAELSHSEKPLTSEELALMTGVTSRTVKSDLKKISGVLLSHGASLSGKPGTGYCLQVQDPEAFAALEKQLRYEQREQYKRIPQTMVQRINYVIMKLLSVDFYLDVDDLAEEMYIEKTTLYACLKEVRTILERFKLTLKSDSHSGVIIGGTEAHKRICIAEFFFHNYMEASPYAEDNMMFSDPDSKKEIRKIREILLRVMKQYGIQMSSFSVENMSIHILVAMRRWLLFDYIKLSEQAAAKVSGTTEEAAGRRLADELAAEFGILLPESEAIYFALHLKSKRINGDAGVAVGPEETERLSRTIAQIVSQIQTRFGIDFSQDEIIIQYLRGHISAMVERLSIGFPFRNSQAYEQRRENLMATVLTYIASTVIRQNYGVFVDDNEKGFLVLYFSLALYRLSMRQGLRIAVTNGRGRPEGILLLNKITQARRGIPDTISFVDVTELDGIPDGSYQIICSPTEIPQVKNIPVLVLGNHASFDAEKLQKAIDLSCMGNINYAHVFPEAWFYPCVKGSDYMGILAEMQKLLTEQQQAADAQLLKECSMMELGNGCALLVTQGSPSQSFLRVFCLKKQVVIKKHPVSLIFWTDAPREESQQLRIMLDLLSRWMQSDGRVSEMRKAPSYRQLVQDLEQLQSAF